MRSRSDQIVSTSGFSKTSDDLLRVVQHDNKISVTSEGSVMDRLHAFFVELECLNVCEFTMEAGPLKYLSELEEWHHESRGLSLLLSADSLLRKKVYKLSNDKRKDFPTFSSALKEVLKNHKQLWKDARSTAELDKFKQVEHDPTSTKRARSTSPPPPPTPTSEARAKKNRARREISETSSRARQGQGQGQVGEAVRRGKAPRADRDPRIPEKEWKKIMSFTYTGARRCPWFNCSLGCRFGDQCRNKHICVQCGGDHPYQALPRQPLSSRCFAWVLWSGNPRRQARQTAGGFLPRPAKIVSGCFARDDM